MDPYDENNCRDCLAPKGTEHKTWCHLDMVRRISEKAWTEGFLAAHYADRGDVLPVRDKQEVPSHLKDVLDYWNPYNASDTDPYE